CGATHQLPNLSTHYSPLSMSRKIDWPNHIVSFFLIIFSILLAFQLEKCSSDRKEDKLVDAHLAEIRKETAFNISQLEQSITALDRTKLRLDTLMGLLDKGEDVERINRFVFQLLEVPYLYLKQNAYNSLTTSGDIRFVDDFEDKSAIVDLYEFHEQAIGMGDLLLETYKESYFNYVKNNMDLKRASPRPLAIYQERVFVNGVSSYYYFVIRCQRLYKKHQERMQEYLATNS
ncbi:MAG: hypothetical protein AAF597_17935, partial [Bacteroidota bacterium]